MSLARQSSKKETDQSSRHLVTRGGARHSRTKRKKEKTMLARPLTLALSYFMPRLPESTISTALPKATDIVKGSKGLTTSRLLHPLTDPGGLGGHSVATEGQRDKECSVTNDEGVELVNRVF